MALQVKIKPLSPLLGSEIPYPRYATPGSAGLDLAACIEREIVIKPGERAKVPTGLAIQMPDAGVVGLVFPRSGNAWKYGVSLTNCVGVIDSDYIGEIQVILQNLDNEQPFVVKRGDRIAQLIVQRVELPEFVEVDELDETSRGEGGYGSSGGHAILG